jgi:hypothetical protein
VFVGVTGGVTIRFRVLKARTFSHLAVDLDSVTPHFPLFLDQAIPAP